MNDSCIPADDPNAAAQLTATEDHADVSLLENALTCAQLAKLLHISVKTVHNRISRDPGRLPEHIRVEGRPLFPKQWVEEYVSRCSKVFRHACR
ncbi:MAG: helix-turn-helix domain-containing protein [Betaproteobacteria bacterium]